jgi:hypothetical protein
LWWDHIFLVDGLVNKSVGIASQHVPLAIGLSHGDFAAGVRERGRIMPSPDTLKRRN